MTCDLTHLTVGTFVMFS